MCSDRDGWVSKKIPISAEGGDVSGLEDFARRKSNSKKKHILTFNLQNG